MMIYPHTCCSASEVTEMAAGIVFGNKLTDSEIGPAVVKEFLSRGLAHSTYAIAPEPLIIATKSVEGIQEGDDMLRHGVSAKELAVENE